MITAKEISKETDYTEKEILFEQARNICTLIKRNLDNYHNNDVMIQNMKKEIIDLRDKIKEIKNKLDKVK